MSSPEPTEDRNSGRATPEPPATDIGGLGTARPRQPAERNCREQSAWEKFLKALWRALSTPAL
jgi:hypothetical protein